MTASTDSVALTGLQSQAIRMVLDLVDSPSATLTPRLALLTGGPGTGKTTTLRALLEALRQRGLRAELAAPSGKAAQRMAEATGHEAATLHRLLGLRPGVYGCTPVEADVLVVDEASMIDVDLCEALLGAASEGTVLVILLVGDADQLPPVGPGQPFLDLLASGQVPYVRLAEVHRQAEQSPIVRAAHSVGAGRAPDYAPGCELVHVEAAEDVPSAVWALICAEGLDPETSQILSGQRKGGAGVDAINDHVERMRLPDGPPLLAGGIRAGTKVIHTRNNYQLGVYNGELGTVLRATVGATPRLSEALVDIAGQQRHYASAQLRELAPAWALTVHKSQGSEWEDVIVVAHSSQGFMLTRRLLYVALTRARRRVWIVGEAAAVVRAAKNRRDAKRVTWLGQRFARDQRTV